VAVVLRHALVQVRDLAQKIADNGVRSPRQILHAYFKTRAPLFLVPLGILCFVTGFVYGN